MDAVRRAAGRGLDLLGLGPVQTPSRIVLHRPPMTLRGYGDPSGDSAVLLVIPAPIKKHYIWDLLPSRSAIRRCIDSGLRVYLIEWGRPSAAQAELGLEHYADRFILDCVDAIERETGRSAATLAGHSLGGTLAAIFAALHPNRVRGLALVGAPVHFAPNVGSLDWLIANSPRLDPVTFLAGNAPGILLNSASYRASPTSYGWSRALDGLLSLHDPQLLHTHLLVQRWTLDETPMPARLFIQIMESLYREDKFMRGELYIGERLANPQQITAPILCVADPRCRVVPAEAMLPLLRQRSRPDDLLLWYKGDTGVALQHVGPLVGRSAHADLWPQITRWMLRCPATLASQSNRPYTESRSTPASPAAGRGRAGSSRA